MRAQGGTRANSFDALRLIAAGTVIAGHAIPLSGRGDPPQVAGVPFFDLAVYVFFAISGYLIATSWRRRPDARSFLARRVMRIFPALVILVILTTFVVGPITTDRSPGEYFAEPQTWAYLRNLALVAEYRLPGVFEDNPITIVNGSLWTIGPEFVCYLLVLASGLVVRRWGGAIARASIYVVVAVVLACLAVIPSDALDGARAVTTAMVFFFVAAFLSEFLEGGARPARLIVILGGVLWLAASFAVPGSIVPLGWIALPLLVVSIGEWEIPLLRRAGRWGDPSYGMYLWGFPLQQLLVVVDPHLDLIADTAIVLALSVAVGLVSWHLVEAPSMSLARTRREAPARGR